MNTPVISRIERDKIQQVKVELLIELARVLDVSVDYLIGRTSVLDPKEVLASDPGATDLVEVYEKLSPDGKVELLTYGLFLVSLHVITAPSSSHEQLVHIHPVRETRAATSTVTASA